MPRKEKHWCRGGRKKTKNEMNTESVFILYNSIGIVEMPENYKLVFDDVILKQLKKAGKDNLTKQILSKMLDKISGMGPLAGKLLDTQLNLFEVKAMRPPIRLYYKIVEMTKEAYVFEYEIKTSQKKQSRTIQRIRFKLKP